MIDDSKQNVEDWAKEARREQNRVPYVPTPEEIAKVSAEIQDEWTEFIRQNRTAPPVPVDLEGYQLHHKLPYIQSVYD